MTQPQGSELADNALLARLPAAQRKRLQALGRTRLLAVDTVVAGAALPRGPLLFPLSGFVALSSGQGPWGQVQLILVGREGAIGANAVFDAEMGVLCASVRADCTARVIERRWTFQRRGGPRGTLRHCRRRHGALRDTAIRNGDQLANKAGGGGSGPRRIDTRRCRLRDNALHHDGVVVLAWKPKQLRQHGCGRT